MSTLPALFRRPAALTASPALRRRSRGLPVSSRHPLPPPRSAGGSGSSAGTGESDTGAAFVQRFRSLADAQPLAADVASGSGCCGSKAAQGQGATSQVAGASLSLPAVTPGRRYPWQAPAAAWVGTPLVSSACFSLSPFPAPFPSLVCCSQAAAPVAARVAPPPAVRKQPPPPRASSTA